MLHDRVRFSLKRYCVMVMDNWTTDRFFWTRKAALRCLDKSGPDAHAYRWTEVGWVEIFR